MPLFSHFPPVVSDSMYIDARSCPLMHWPLVAARIQNLELLQEYGSTVWKTTNELLVRMLESAQSQLQEVRKKIQDINWQRKNEQVEAGTRLKSLEDRWALVSMSILLHLSAASVCCYCRTGFDNDGLNGLGINGRGLTATKIGMKNDPTIRIHYRNYAHYTLYRSCLPI